MSSRPTRAQAYADLDALYDSLPPLACRGLCHDTCTVAPASELERQRIRETHGKDLGAQLTYDQVRAAVAAGNRPRCPALGPLNTCTVYEVRPLICRAWGTTPRLRCEHGCVPEGYVPDEQMLRALVEVEELSVQVTGVSRLPEGWKGAPR